MKNENEDFSKLETLSHREKRHVRPLLFRQHRGGLAESMQTVREMSTRNDLEAFVRQHYGEGVVTVEPYGWDNRIGWDTHIVCLNGNACGFTNGNLDRAHALGMLPEMIKNYEQNT